VAPSVGAAGEQGRDRHRRGAGQEIAFLCRRYSAQKAKDMGLINAVVPDDQLDTEVMRWADELLTLSPRYLEITKVSSNTLWNQHRDAYMHGVFLLTQAIGSYDMIEVRGRSWRSARPASRAARRSRATARVRVQAPERDAMADDDPTTASGIPLRPVYGPDDLDPARAAARASRPGEPPFLRGANPRMYRGKPWRIFQLSGCGSPEDLDRRLHFLLEQGETGFIMKRDRVTNDHLYDIDHPEVEARREDVGQTGAMLPPCRRGPRNDSRRAASKCSPLVRHPSTSSTRRGA